MAPITSELATLRALTFRISSTPTAQLPHHVSAITASLANCRTLLSSPQTSISKSSSESSVAIHKYRTLLSTLLQDRTIQGRWSAIVLIKATVEAGGWETLQKCLPWVRGLLGILNKPEPPSSKKLCIIVLTRIFILTREYPTLVREITTPSLPAFIQAGLQLASSRTPSSVLQVILESFNELLPRHPTIFRSYLKQIHPLLARLITPTPSSKLGQEPSAGGRLEVPSSVVDAAQRLYVQIPFCASKGATSEEWEKSMKTTIASTHRVADRIFRAVFEDWQPAATETNGHTFGDEVQDLDADSLALPVWSGIFAGSERLVHLLRLLQHYLAGSTANPIGFNIGNIMDLITRMLSLTVPGASGKSFQNTVKVNNQVSKEERENLWLLLPGIHVAAIEVLLVLAQRTCSSTLPLDTLILDQLVWVFSAEKENVGTRAACYHAIASLLQRSGVALPKSSIDSLVPLMRACCEDILPLESTTAPKAETPGQAKANGKTPSQVTANADSFLNATGKSIKASTGLEGLHEAAHNLLPALFGNIRALYFSDAMRSRLDRTAILTQHKDAMVASVLNPPPSKKFGKPAASILPLMARSFPASPDIEGMLRPRMPVIRLGQQDVDADGDGEDEEEDDEMSAEEDGQDETMEHEEDSFAGDKLDTILEITGRMDTKTEGLDENEVNVIDTEFTAIATITKGLGEAVEMRDFDHQREFGKRPHVDPEPPSPSKRVRFAEEVESTPSATQSSSMQEQSLSDLAQRAAPVTQTSDFMSTATASAIPQLPQPGDERAAGGDSDEDDVVSLVLGQDTDEESD
ncbi:hypothetical protein EK21DRAFT_78687 [Setomelanomma holmii]|uniref:Pre-rRNA-processing protein RIX1 n=1 Tax=Setomelanomma holmii TaxID=210430 RepID=A0A9P4GZB1_9PLEO|nr:hypothetical protein EK21DRAFT_78687 [Setomelanomma holmii]